MHSKKYAIRYSRRISIIAIMAALALVGNYILVAIPNVELGTTILFVTAYIFGFAIAASTAIIMSIIFSVINPWGAFIPQIWISQVLGWLFVTATGAIMGDERPKEEVVPKGDAGLFVIGAFLTAFFDLVSNLGYSWAFYIPYEIAVITGFPFMIVHIFSNAVLFSLVVPRLHSITMSQFSSSIWDVIPEQADLLSEE
jgi:energy-coupling factor transport system substrate-specific component